MRRSVWLGALIAPMPAFLVLPLLQLLLSLQAGFGDEYYRFSFINKGTYLVSIFAVAVSYVFVLAAGVPAWFLLHRYGVSRMRHYLSIAAVCGGAFIVFVIDKITPFWTVTVLSTALIVAWVFALLVPTQRPYAG